MTDGDLQRYLQLKTQLRRLSGECAAYLAVNNRGPEYQRAVERRDAVTEEMVQMRTADRWQPLPMEVMAS
jgi:hypothetical protein